MRTKDYFEPVYKVNSLGVIELEHVSETLFKLTIIPYSLILDSVRLAKGDSSKFWSELYRRAFTENIGGDDRRFSDTQREYLDETEFPFDNLTLRQLVNLASAYKKTA